MRKSALFLSVLLLPAVVNGATLTVTTIDNNNSAVGQLSLKQAIQQAQNGDTINFNIPGAGPHVIATPDEGYPFITQDNLTIDGYSQPGSSRNTNPILSSNNAALKIVLDSTTGPEQRTLLAPLNNPGFGDEESAIFALLGAENAKIRGLSFKSRVTAENSSDPGIYCIALINDSMNAHISGCWFGLDPDGVTLASGRASIASFRGENSTSSSGLIVGTNGDGVDDRGEFNVHAGMGIAVHIETSFVKVAGNFVNLLPDGKTILASDQVGEFLENGTFADHTTIGTDGDGVSDENERNIIGRVNYDVIAEFWRPLATNIVFAGNYVGFNTDKSATADIPAAILAIRKQSSARIGTNGDGVSDDIEANHITGLTRGQFLSWHGSNRDADGIDAAKIVVRNNVMVTNTAFAMPFDDGTPISYLQYYNTTLLDAASVTVFSPSFTNNGTQVTGNFPAPNATEFPYAVVDFYLADPHGLTQGALQTASYLGRVWDNGTGDNDPTANSFSWQLPFPVTTSTVIAAVTYSKDADKTEVGRAVTSPFGAAAEAFRMAVTASASGNAIDLGWAGGTAPFLLQRSVDLNGTNWINILSTSERRATVPKDLANGFFRVQDNYAGPEVIQLTAYITTDAETTALAGNPTGYGVASISLEGTDKLNYVVTYTGLTVNGTGVGANNGHVHIQSGDSTTTGGTAGGQFVPVPSGTAGTYTGVNTITPATRDSILAGKGYVNIHTGTNPGGEIRGQILRTKYVATLNGANEVPAVTTGATGDATVEIYGNELRYSVTFNGLEGGNASAAHIHGRASTTASAGVLLGFTGVPAATSGTFSGVATANTETRLAIVDGLSYVNVHTPGLNAGAGEIRGQLTPAP